MNIGGNTRWDDDRWQILLADDDEDDYVMTRDLLADIKGDRCDLTWVATYEAALLAIDDCRHDVYLLDYRLGPKSGLDLLREAMRRGCRAPLILVTGQGDLGVDIEAMRSGAADYLVKGQIDAMQLERAIRHAVERKRAEEALRESEERYRELIENARDLIFTLDLAGNFTSINRAGEQITGYRREQVIGMNVNRLLAPEYRNRIDWTPVGERRSAEAVEVEILTSDRRRVWLEVSLQTVYRGSRMVGLQGIARDVTERRLLEEQLRSSQKMEAVGRLAGGVAHDFNNLLTAIIGFSEFALRRPGVSEPLRGDLEEIQRAGERAASLTRQLLAFSRRQVLQPKVLDLNTLILEMEKMLRRVIREDVELRTSLDVDLAPVKADPGQLEQVILNLVVNARDAMPDGGRILIETANVDDDEIAAPDFGAPPDKRYLKLVVRDTGCGIDPQLQERIFEPFFTTKEQGKGTGLGLSTVYGIVQQSGGFIRVESAPGEGAAFKVYLPQVEEGIAAARQVAAAKPAGGSETVLLVEDEAIVRTLTREVLQMNGYTVLEAARASQAIKLCREHGGPLHLLLSDVVMPEMNGHLLASEIRTLRPEVKILFMSGYAADAVAWQGASEPGVALIEKPFTPGSLTRKVREVLDQIG